MKRLSISLALCALAAAANAGDFVIRADTGRPMNYPRGTWFTGTMWTPGRDGTGLPYWTTPTNLAPAFQIWTEQKAPALTIAFAARMTPGGGSVLQWVGWNVMASPNCDRSVTNFGGPTTNEFVLLSATDMGGFSATNQTYVNSNAACFFRTNWCHYAISYTPETGGWKWWINGAPAGAFTTTTRSWTNGCQHDSMMYLTGWQLGSWLSRVDWDRLAAWHHALTDAEAHADYLSWKVRRFGVTEDPPFSLYVWSEDVPVTMPATSDTYTNLDAVFRIDHFAQTVFDKQLHATPTRGNAVWGYGVSTGSVDACGFVTNLPEAGATAFIYATNVGPQAYQATAQLTLTRTDTASSNIVWAGGVAGSLRSNATEWVSARIAGGEGRGQFSAYDHATTNYARATNALGHDLAGMEAIGVWNSQKGDGSVTPTLVAQDLAVCCAHSVRPAGTIVRWVTAAGSVVTSAVQASTQVSDLDLQLYRIAPPITNVQPMPVMPTNWAAYMPVQSNGTTGANAYGPPFGNGIPCLKTSQTGRVDVLDLTAISSVAAYRESLETNRAAYYAPLINGDSGLPAILPVNGTGVVVSCWKFYTYGAFTGYPADQEWTDAAVRVGSTNRVTRVNLGGFVTYP